MLKNKDIRGPTFILHEVSLRGAIVPSERGKLKWHRLFVARLRVTQ